MIYLNKDITEGDYFPDALIWHGKIMPLRGSAPVGWALRVKLPWWVRRYNQWYQKDMLHQLMFGVHQFSGPEKYEFWFSPIEDQVLV